MSLARELEQTNELLRVGLGQLAEVGAKASAPKPIGPEPVPAARVFPAAAMLALRAHLKPVPPEYGKVNRRARVACVCRRAHLFHAAGFHECNCGRVFAFTGRRLLVMRPDA